MTEEAKEAKQAEEAAPEDGAEAAKTKATPPRIQVYVPEEENERIRNANDAVGRSRGYASLSDLLWRCALAEVERWEQEDNGGKPFPKSSFPVARRGRPPRQS
jgi:hypothetical protein